MRLAPDYFCLLKFRRVSTSLEQSMPVIIIGVVMARVDCITLDFVLLLERGHGPYSVGRWVSWSVSLPWFLSSLASCLHLPSFSFFNCDNSLICLAFVSERLRKSAIHGLPVTLGMLRVKPDKSDWFWSQSWSELKRVGEHVSTVKYIFESLCK